MRNFKNYVILSVALIIAVLVIMSQGVQASPTLIFGNNTTTNTSANAVGDATNTTNATSNITTSNSVNTTSNTVSVNNITTTKDPAKTNTTTNTTKGSGNLPQTGENDIYIVSAIGVVALIVGGVAYMKSRKYDM